MKIKKFDPLLIWSFILGLIPAIFIIHIIPKDFSQYYFISQSLLKFGKYSYQFIQSYCDNPLNTGLNSRPLLLPVLMAVSFLGFGQNIFGLYLPFFLSRILLLPLTYRVAKAYMPKKFALLCALTILFIPKLQTYSLGAFEADVFVVLFYLLALYFYQKTKALHFSKYAILTGISLGFGALSKPTGFTIALGFILAIIFEKNLILKKAKERNKLVLIIIFFVLVSAIYIFPTFLKHGQIYLTTHHDRSLGYILVNLPSLVYTIPLYFGLQFSAGIKALLMSIVLLGFMFIGFLKSIKTKNWVLILPTFITLFIISTTQTCLIGYNIPANYEFITILGFMMFPASLLFWIGVKSFYSFISKYLLPKRFKGLLLPMIIILILYKIVNNYFSSPYALDYIPSEYYLTLPTIISHNKKLPDAQFRNENGIWLNKGPIVHQIIREQFSDLRSSPFSNSVKQLLLLAAIITFLLFLVAKEKIKSD